MKPRAISEKRNKPSIETLGKMLDALRKDPELMEIARKFVKRHGGRIFA